MFLTGAFVRQGLPAFYVYQAIIPQLLIGIILNIVTVHFQCLLSFLQPLKTVSFV